MSSQLSLTGADIPEHFRGRDLAALCRSEASDAESCAFIKTEGSAAVRTTNCRPTPHNSLTCSTIHTNFKTWQEKTLPRGRLENWTRGSAGGMLRCHGCRFEKSAEKDGAAQSDGRSTHCPAGKFVPVSYAPAQPKTAVLEPGLNASFLLLYAIGAVFILTSLLFITLAGRRRFNERPRF